MSNYPLVILATLSLAGVSAAADKPAATLAGAPAGTAAVAATKYVQAATGSTLVFGFDQAGAASEGSFGKFSTTLSYDEKNLAASTLAVTVQVDSLDTQDADRDTTLKSADLLDAEKHRTASYTANSLEKTTSGVQAVGKLTLRGVTKDLRLPLTIKPTANGLELSGTTAIKRLDYGVGQGDWKSTESVGDDIRVTYKVALIKAK